MHIEPTMHVKVRDKKTQKSMSKKLALSLHNCVLLDPAANAGRPDFIHTTETVGEENYCTLIYYERHISAAILDQMGNVL